jgi:hypothetical protein
MGTEAFLKKNIIKELTSQGFSICTVEYCANKGIEYYKKTAKFSGGAYLECVNHAGSQAQQMSVGIKFKTVKAKPQKRTKRPQDAWDF